MARFRPTAHALETGWEMAEMPPDAAPRASLVRTEWRPAAVPGTVAGALGLTLDDTIDLDASDYWYRKTLEKGEVGDVLRLGGLATLAEVWVDDERVLVSDNMFHEHEVDVRGLVREGSVLAIRFSSLRAALRQKRPRPRWRATIVAEQQLRWARTSLLGRIPAWTPPIAPVGPYRPITIGMRGPIVSADVRARLDGSDGVVDAVVTLREAMDGECELVVGEHRAVLAVDASRTARGTVVVPHAPRWWPHTHGVPARVPVSVIASGTTFDLGATGFRTIEVDREDGAFTLVVNGSRVFCRGACWMPLDVISLGASRERLRSALEQVRDAGMNMVRLSGTMLYETAAFHELCDELGILVWQDFMFANMDYPIADERFREAVRREATEVMQRLQLSPSLAVCCGGSEVEQQAAMMGLPESEWASSLFRELLPGVVAASRPDVVYVPSSPTGSRGTLPFHVDDGVSHYYGVGAYMRPLEDARRARVRFTSECLAFANVPRDETIEAFMRDGERPTQHPRWKARVARDRSTPWDFDDVRDHYVAQIFGVDPSAIRRTDVARYLELGRAATGEAMAAAMTEWRRTRSECAGALVWFLRDLWEGAGWGVIDSRGQPKAPYYYLKRVLAPVALLVTDEGLNGLALHAVNDLGEPLAGSVEVVLYRGETPIAHGRCDVDVPPRSSIELNADALLGRFTDITHAYLFGPPGHDVTVATLTDRTTTALVGRAFHFPERAPERTDLGVQATAERVGATSWRVTVRSKLAARAVAVDARGLVADDDFFHVAPGGAHEVLLTGAAHLSATVKPLNALLPTKVT
jgi:beta-mannosidase